MFESFRLGKKTEAINLTMYLIFKRKTFTSLS